MGASLGPGGGRNRRGRAALNAEINVTPFVDVMLVLLIVFMITAPLLVPGIEIRLPQESAEPLPASEQRPLEVTVTEDGKVYIQQTEIDPDELPAKLNAITNEGFDAPIYLRADEAVDFGRVVSVMDRITDAGYTRLAIVTDPRRREGR